MASTRNLLGDIVALGLALGLAAATAACGPDSRDDDDDTGNDTIDAGGGGQPDAFTGPQGAVNGTVWMPSNAPGMVPAGEEIPVSEALIYVSTGVLPAIPQEVYCDQCTDPQGYFTKSDAKGNFTLSASPGTYQLAIQKGQFRLDQQVVITENQTVTLTSAQTTLPSDHDPANGKWLPKTAIGVGSYDDVETIFGKIGVGMVDGSGNWIGSAANDNIDLYSNGGSTGEDGEFAALLADLTRMKQYHLIVMPCTSSGAASTALFSNPTIRANIIAYVSAGGKWYVADWASEFEDVVWPEFIVFESSHDTAAAGCTGGACNDGDGFPYYDSNHSKAVDEKLHAWLQGQKAPNDLGVATAIDADHFKTVDNYDHIISLGSIVIGMDDEGLPITETPHAFILGEHNAGEGPIHPLTVTFEPVGCGRVLYTTFHTTPTAHAGLIPQERVLLYLIGEIGVCKAGPIVE